MNVRRASAKQLEEAVTALRDGELVAFPTETVYGLGANARDANAVRRIFELKGRPTTHPLIVHLDSARFLHRWAREVPPAASRLAAAFWPGPLTLVLPRSLEVSDVVTGGQDTVALRVPSHPMALQLLTAFGGGVAAPSANRYGRVSPTRADHVREEFGDAVRVILDGGECSLGIESTIVAFEAGRARLLRPGPVTQHEIEKVIGPIAAGAVEGSPRVPGSSESHYAPLTPVEIVPPEKLDARIEELLGMQQRIAVLSMRPPFRALLNVTWINAGIRPRVYVHDFYANLRALDRAAAHRIVVEEPPDGSPWVAVRDRLKRAAGGNRSGFEIP
jgi:L-threonylcarbamoyladenylate synthase